jgi:methylmalonyl-CoA mutase, C-terminal domain
MSDKSRAKLLLGKAGLDAHELGARLLAKGLKEAGLEVVYLGLRTTPEEVVDASVHEDIAVIGISSYGGGHIAYARKLMDLLKKRGLAKEKYVIFGGTVPKQDIKALKDSGVDEVFQPEHKIADVANYVKGKYGLAA